MMEQDAITTGAQLLGSGAVTLPPWLIAIGSLGAMIAAFITLGLTVRERKRARKEADRASDQADKANSYREDLTKTQDRIADTQARIQAFVEKEAEEERDRRARVVLVSVREMEKHLRKLHDQYKLGVPNPRLVCDLTMRSQTYLSIIETTEKAHADVQMDFIAIKNGFLDKKPYGPHLKKLLDAAFARLDELKARYESYLIHTPNAQGNG